MNKGQRPAFPNHPNQSNNAEWKYGITIRDYFAAKAMQGFISDREMYMSMMVDRRTSGLGPDEYIANQSYNLADAMLKQREK